jgi:hypothetical protein
MKLFTAPEHVPCELGTGASVMLLGSIEQGVAEEWQEHVVQELQEYNISIFNPRRATWDSTWVQSTDNPEFVEQVNWELDQIWRSDIIFMYLQAGTKSPISLMELGYIAGRGLGTMFPVIVVCPEGFWRKGNVDIICDRSDFLVCQSLEEGLHVLKKTITEYVQQWAH